MTYNPNPKVDCLLQALFDTAPPYYLRISLTDLFFAYLCHVDDDDHQYLCAKRPQTCTRCCSFWKKPVMLPLRRHARKRYKSLRAIVYQRFCLYLTCFTN